MRCAARMSGHRLRREIISTVLVNDQNTTLLYAITLLEILSVADTVTSQDDFVGRGLQAVTLPFVGFVFWAVSYSMSRESRRLEARLGVGVR